MGPGNFHSAAAPGPQLFLYWSDRYATTSREQSVSLVRQTSSEWTVLSPVRIAEQTPVYLSGGTAMGNGIILSCRLENTAYLITISMTNEHLSLPSCHEFDPGVLNIDDFLTEDEEKKILDSLEDEIPYSVTVQRKIVRALSGYVQDSLEGLARLSRRLMLLLVPAF